ncbi:MAG: leucyl aminopeptidase [Bacteroidales bacterium]|jgi:leucyl aminopeptidase|nr:leucyl aminopeptidase [Bacteroidales bacterium]
MMNINIIKTKDFLIDIPVIYLTPDFESLKDYSFSPAEITYIKNQVDEDKKLIKVNSYFKWSYIHVVDYKQQKYIQKEKLRRAAGDLYQEIKANKHQEILIVDLVKDTDLALAYIEGLGLSHYQFLKYQSQQEKKRNTLQAIKIYNSAITQEHLNELQHILEAVFYTKDLVNEPVASLNAGQLAGEFQKMGELAGFDVETFNKKKIESLKMNGLLTVNKGSVDPPTFSVLTWKPENAVNENPYMLIGKGIVYDTGGMNLKTGNYLDTMKSDMAGAASVAGALFALAKAKIPVYVIALIPATDNRTHGNAYVPDDIIRFKNGVSVEVRNTDAEGRLILADALIFAKQYHPRLVIDIATLTGSAAHAVGNMGIVAMSTAAKEMELLRISATNVYERIVEFPLWDEYNQMLKSDIADIQNIGGKEAGAITAALFLNHFVDYPWIHLDIAGSAFLSKADNYRGVGATGVGVRLFFDFFKSLL